MHKLKELIGLCLDKHIPFVSYKKQHEKDVFTIVQIRGQVQMYKSIKEADGLSGFVYAPFHEKTQFPIIFFEPEIIIKNDQIPHVLLNKIRECKSMYPKTETGEYQSTNKADYILQAQKFISRFNIHFQKAVLSRILVLENNSFSASETFLKLCSGYEDAFCHLINIPGAGTWMGASPEKLIISDGYKAETMALAGTRKTENNCSAWGIKEQKEQQLVSDHIKSILDQFSINYFEEGPQNLLAGNIEHLSTRFSFNIGDLNITELLTFLHPTPAVAGLPVNESVDLIHNTEQHNREYYSGYLGMVEENKNCHLMVNLRCMKITDKQLVLFSGGGLTQQSIPEKEWHETEMKTKTLLNIF